VPENLAAGAIFGTRPRKTAPVLALVGETTGRVVISVSSQSILQPGTTFWEFDTVTRAWSRAATPDAEHRP
jgi:hypothetical protein